MNPFLQHFASE
jgi:hypothetical protein